MPRNDADDRAELVVRRYFDHFLNEVFPTQLAAAITSHDKDSDAHSGVVKKVDRFQYLLTGFAAAGGFGGGVAATKLLGLLH